MWGVLWSADAGPWLSRGVPRASPLHGCRRCCRSTLLAFRPREAEYPLDAEWTARFLLVGEHVDEEGERLSHSGCRWCDDPVAPRLVGRLRDVLAATVGVTVDGGRRQVRHRQPAVPPRGQGSADADNCARSFLIKSCWQSDTVLAES